MNRITPQMIREARFRASYDPDARALLKEANRRSQLVKAKKKREKEKILKEEIKQKVYPVQLQLFGMGVHNI